MSQVATSFADSTYSASNKPSTTTLKADIQALETAVNTHNAATTGEHGVTGTMVGTSDAQTLTNKTISGASNTLSVLSAAWPIGSVFTGVVATSPATLLGFGTWSAFGAGRMLIGIDSGDTDFDTAEETGGSKTVTIGQTNLPNISTGAGTAHTHIQDAHTHSATSQSAGGSAVRSGGAGAGSGGGTIQSATATNQNESAHTHSLGGSGTALNVMNPFITVYFWKRTA